NYNRTFNSDHRVTELGLLEGQRRVGDNFFAQRELALDLDQLFAGITDNQIVSMNTGAVDLYERTNMGIVGRATYDFRTKYLAEYGCGEDGTSLFRSANRKGILHLGSVGWRLSEETFWKNWFMRFLIVFNLRASYGVMKDVGASSYQF